MFTFNNKKEKNIFTIQLVAVGNAYCSKQRIMNGTMRRLIVYLLIDDYVLLTWQGVTSREQKTAADFMRRHGKVYWADMRFNEKKRLRKM